MGRLVYRLEEGSGHPGIDIKLIEEILQRGGQHLKRLGLDPADTTVEELFAVLIRQVADLDAGLWSVTHLGQAALGDSQGSKYQKLFNAVLPRQTVWVLRRSAAKRLIIAVPPQKVMQQLGYRSAASMIKNQPIEEIMLAAEWLEDPAWKLNLHHSYLALKAGDFEPRPLQFLYLPAQKWPAIAQAAVRRPVVASAELAAIALGPAKTGPAGFVTTLLLHLHKQVTRTQALASWLVTRHFDPHFGAIIYETLQSDLSRPVVMLGGQPIDWPTLMRAVCINPTAYQPLFDSALEPADFCLPQASVFLERLQAKGGEWSGLEWCGYLRGRQVVSCNVADLAYDLLRQHTPAQRSKLALSSSLKRELLARYAAEPVFARQILAQLDNYRPGDETISISLKLRGDSSLKSKKAGKRG